MPLDKNTLSFPVLKKIYENVGKFPERFTTGKSMEEIVGGENLSQRFNFLARKGYLEKIHHKSEGHQYQYRVINGDELIARYIELNFQFDDFFMKFYLNYLNATNESLAWEEQIQYYGSRIKENINEDNFKNDLINLVLLWHLNSNIAGFAVGNMVDLISTSTSPSLKESERNKFSKKISLFLNKKEFAVFLHFIHDNNGKRQYRLKNKSELMFGIFEFNLEVYNAYCDRFNLNKIVLTAATINPKIISNKKKNKIIYKNRKLAKRKRQEHTDSESEVNNFENVEEPVATEKNQFYSSLNKNTFSFFKKLRQDSSFAENDLIYDFNNDDDVKKISNQLIKLKCFASKQRNTEAETQYHFKKSCFDTTDCFKLHYSEEYRNSISYLPFAVIAHAKVEKGDIVTEYFGEVVNYALLKPTLSIAKQFNAASFIQHSVVNANVKFEVFQVSSEEGEEQHQILMVATRAINPGEMLYANYVEAPFLKRNDAYKAGSLSFS